MTPELIYLAGAIVLAVVQIFLAAGMRARETGLRYNASPRDVPSPVPVGKITGRIMRAQANMLETLPLFIGAVLAAHVADVHTETTFWGAALYFWGRVVYIPIYALGIFYVRGVVWIASMVGVLMVVGSLV